MENTCVCCDEIIPEGRQVCLSCEKAILEKSTISVEEAIKAYNEFAKVAQETLGTII